MRQKSVNNNNPMSPENMQELAGRLSQYAEDDNMNGEPFSKCCVLQGHLVLRLACRASISCESRIAHLPAAPM